jgi:putative phage-type endonuclease
MSYTVIDPAPDTAHWLRMRKQGLGASDSASVLGLSKWGTPLSVYLDKLSDSIDDTMSDRQDWGHRLEEPIAQWVRDTKHLEVTGSPGLIKSEEFPWLLATPDRKIVEGDVVVPLEIKSSDAFMKDAWGDGIPLNYQIQIQQQILIMGAPHGYLVVLHGGNTPDFYRVPADPEFHEQLIRLTREFWEGNILAGVAPEPITLDDAALLWSGDPDVKVEGGEPLYDLWGAYGLMQAEAVEINGKLDAVKLQLQIAMQDAVELTHQGQTLFTWRPRKGTTRFDDKAFQNDHPDLYPKYLKTGAPTRTFLRKKAKDND